jgi:hypothetical protein
MTADSISNDLRAVLRRLKLSRLLDTLAERLTEPPRVSQRLG